MEREGKGAGGAGEGKWGGEERGGEGGKKKEERGGEGRGREYHHFFLYILSTDVLSARQ